MSEPTVINKKSLTAVIKMPKQILISDPLYLEKESIENCPMYQKNFENLPDNWSGELILNEDLLKYPENEFSSNEVDITDTNVRIILAFNKKMISVLKSNQYYSQQSVNKCFIGVDSAEYDIYVNDDMQNIYTACDGCWGDVSEYTTDGRLEAIDISLGFPDTMKYDEVREILERLFEFKF